MLTDSTIEDINKAMQDAWVVFHQYRRTPLKKRSHLMSTIGVELKD